MSEREQYPAGVPCWVETLQPDPRAALDYCLWEARAREGAQLVNDPGTWAMSSLHTTDPEGAKAFYGSVFGWQPDAFGPPEAQLTLCRLPGYVGGEAQQPIPRDVVAVMAPSGDAVAAVPPRRGLARKTQAGDWEIVDPFFAGWIRQQSPLRLRPADAPTLDSG